MTTSLLPRPVVAMLIAFTAVVGFVENGDAHQPSEGFVVFDLPTPSGDGYTLHARWDVALQDLARVETLDADGDGRVLGRELAAAEDKLLAWARAGQSFSTATPCVVAVTLAGVTQHLDGTYASFEWRGTCGPAPDGLLRIQQEAMFAVDPGHRALVRIGRTTAVLRADSRSARLSFVAPPSASDTFATFIGEGVLHIWEGLDHVLFLLALLFPAVLRRRRAAAAAGASAHCLEKHQGGMDLLAWAFCTALASRGCCSSSGYPTARGRSRSSASTSALSSAR